MALTVSDNVFDLDNYSVVRKNTAAIQMSVVCTDGGAPAQTVTFAIDNAGTSGLTTAQILASIEQVAISNVSGVALIGGALNSSAAIDIPTGGTQAVIASAMINHDGGRYILQAYAAGF